MSVLKNAFIFFISFGLSSIFTVLVIKILFRKEIMDIPNARSSHRIPVPRGGGISIIGAFLVAMLIAYLFFDVKANIYLMAGLIMIALIGAIDDFQKGVPPILRLFVQLISASIVIYGYGVIHTLPLPYPLHLNLGITALPLTLLWIIGITNIYNFLDGIDGFAGTQGFIASLSLALLANDRSVTMEGLAIAGACGGFLVYNWAPARIFMGDVGSCSLGFLLASLPLQFHGTLKSDGIFYTAIFLWFFLADGAFTMLRRLINGEKLWEPHRSHLYQRLVICGMSHRGVTIGVMTITAILSLLGIYIYIRQNNALKWGLLFVSLTLFFIYGFTVRLIERRRRYFTDSTFAA